MIDDLVPREEWEQTSVHRHSGYACVKCGCPFPDPHAVYVHLESCRGRPNSRRVPFLAIPNCVDSESRLVLQYINAEIDRWNAHDRMEPIAQLLDTGRERLKRYGITD